MADKGSTTTVAPKSTAPDTTAWTTAGRNVRFQTLDNVLFIAVNIGKTAYDAVANTTEKGNKTIASTLGNIPVSDTLKMGLNIYGPPPVAVTA